MADSRWTRKSFLFIWQIAIFPVITNGQYSAWSSWSECSKTCFGKQTRSRQCSYTEVNCKEELTDARDCGQASWNSGCFSQPMIIALAVIGTAILVAFIISIILYRTNQNIKKKNSQREAKNMAEAIEERYDAVTNPLHSGAKTFDRRFLSPSSFPTPIQEPEEMDLDNFAFDQESLNESIQSMTLAFGTDEEYQSSGAATKTKEKPMALTVVSVTETQVIDRGNPSSVDDEKRKEDEKPPPIYAVVVKPKKSEKPKIV